MPGEAHRIKQGVIMPPVFLSISGAAMISFRKSFWFRQHEFCVSIQTYPGSCFGIRKHIHNIAFDIGYYSVMLGYYKWGNIPFKTRRL